jgi:hypothetical protein
MCHMCDVSHFGYFLTCDNKLREKNILANHERTHHLTNTLFF